MRKDKRYQDYLLVNDDDGDVDMPEFYNPKCHHKKCICCLTTFLALAVIIFLLLFIALPFLFMNSIFLQRNLIFTHFNLPKSPSYFASRHFPAYKNRYITFNYTKDGVNETLGVWHILPVNLAYNKLYGNESEIDFNEALLNSNYSVLIYFHGTGEARSYNERKYELFTYNFHVIAFDYRGYADSSDGELTEDGVVDDCIELYKWVKSKTNSDIYVWGHSLGAALATRTVSALENIDQVHTKGLILESGFTSLHDELYVHPISKLFAWLPWFEHVIIEPLEKNGFIFDTVKHLKTVSCPVMILHAQDDDEIPCAFGRELAVISTNRNITTIYHEFDAKYGYKHNYIYQDPFMKFYIMNFLEKVNGEMVQGIVDLD